MFLLPQCLVSMCHVLNILIAVQFPVSILSVQSSLSEASPVTLRVQLLLLSGSS